MTVSVVDGRRSTAVLGGRADSTILFLPTMPRLRPSTVDRPLLLVLALALLLQTSCTLQFYRVEICETLYFGTARVNAAPVGDDEWQRFVDDEIAPRFPDGFTVSEAQGQWRTRDGAVQRERTHAVLIVHRDGRGDPEIAAIVSAYRKRFAQEAVLRTRERCGVTLQ
ncbi:MAG: choline dehydrogenase [Acidobacteria bacterium]|nr:choline dehydrogenase [Acidobacteriota bacterium]